MTWILKELSCEADLQQKSCGIKDLSNQCSYIYSNFHSFDGSASTADQSIGLAFISDFENSNFPFIGCKYFVNFEDSKTYLN